MTSQVKGLILFPLPNISVVGSQVRSSLKTTIRDFQILIPHKQHPYTEINKLTVTDKIFHRLPYSCAWHLSLFNHGKQTFMGCMKDFPGLFNIHVSSEHTSWLRLHTDLKNIPVTLRYSDPVTQPANVQVFSNRRHCTLSACSTTMCL